MLFIVFIALGLVFGSFAGAQVWRLRAGQLEADKLVGEPYDKKEHKRLQKLAHKKSSQDRSRCLECGHTLGWKDLIPLVSWLSTRGKCRYCGKKIGWFEPAIEVGTALLFVVSYIFLFPDSFTTVGAMQFYVWMVACVLMVILFVYDVKWLLLPDKINFSLIGVAAIYALLGLVDAGFTVNSVVSLGLGVGVLSGLYLLLYIFSRGAWVGFGDVKLGLGLALLLGTWELSFMALFLANLLGTLIVLPLLATKNLKRGAHVPFGPLLIAGAIITVFFGDMMLDWYKDLIYPGTF